MSVPASTAARLTFDGEPVARTAAGSDEVDDKGKGLRKVEVGGVLAGLEDLKDAEGLVLAELLGRVNELMVITGLLADRVTVEISSSAFVVVVLVATEVVVVVTRGGGLGGASETPSSNVY